MGSSADTVASGGATGYSVEPVPESRGYQSTERSHDAEVVLVSDSRRSRPHDNAGLGRAGAGAERQEGRACQPERPGPASTANDADAPSRMRIEEVVQRFGAKKVEPILPGFKGRAGGVGP